MEMATREYAKVVAYYPKQMGDKFRRVAFSGKVYGTTFTGHPCCTTLGNSLRAINFNGFARYMG